MDWVRATILPGVTIGDNAVIGAASVVTKSVPTNSIAVGNPAKIVKEIPPISECYDNNPDYTPRQLSLDSCSDYNQSLSESR